MCLGPSMLPTFNRSGDVVLLERVSVLTGDVARGDVVIARSPSNPRHTVCKRILGIGGDVIAVPNAGNFGGHDAGGGALGPSVAARRQRGKLHGFARLRSSAVCASAGEGVRQGLAPKRSRLGEERSVAPYSCEVTRTHVERSGGIALGR